MSAYSIATRGLPQGVLATIMEMLYSNSEKGIAKLDFSDFTGMYQDRARTIPYTAVEQPLGSFTGLNGVIATAPADVNRGVVSARANGFTATEDISQAAWLKRQVTVSGVDKIQEDSSTNLHYLRQDVPVFAGVYTLSFEAKQSERTIAWASLDGSSNTLWFDLANGVSGGIGVGSSKITSIGDGWYKCEYIVTKTAGTATCFVGCSNSTTITNYPGVTGNGIFLRKLAIAKQGTAYQRVNTPTDYDTAGFPHYLTFNGINTAYVTPSIDFTGTDKMTVWAGVTRLTQVLSIVCELSTTVTNIGMFSSSISSGNYASFISRGTGGDYPNAYSPLAPPPVSAVIGGSGSIGDQISTARVNGVSINSDLNQGTGNYGNYPLYIGARAGTSLFFNGRIYNLIVRGAATPLTQIESVETLIRQKMRLP